MDEDVIYIGDDERNADHRTQTTRPGAYGRPQPVGGRRTVVVPPSRRPTVISTASPRPQVVMTAQPYYQPASLASRFGMSTGELIDTGIQILAAIQPLPGAPVAQGDAGIDVENLVTYQGALAAHAKRDEQLRTLGTLLVRILK
ncbi:MAG: hypothetical protein H6709_02280 [Kofleriaceae bacterium]|nr:hypothetical protein [Myxococcales bacterium]MCB9507852.1 hypothetical protein [Myxococcales bacterium]MCB9570899.1 hypothetical protein [Kofleriaceae bacterium]